MFFFIRQTIIYIRTCSNLLEYRYKKHPKWSIKKRAIPTLRAISTKKLLLLSECCLQSYLYSKGENNIQIPPSYSLISPLKTSSSDEHFALILESEKDIIIAFRGTQTNENLIKDMDIKQVPYPFKDKSGYVHHGFLSIYEEVRTELFELLSSFPATKNIVVTGHSLGGALAILSALDLRINTTFTNISMYNFGAPKVGDVTFTSTYNRLIPNSYRVINLFDGVPLFPPSQKLLKSLLNENMDYRHVKQLIAFSKYENSLYNTHRIHTYITALRDWK